MTDDERFDGFGNAVYHARANSTATPYGFVGKKGYQTDASGLLLLGHRYYDPAIGRFLSRDPIHDGDNWYAYCDNNPLGKTDPSGEGAEDTLEQASQTLPPGGRTIAGVALIVVVAVEGLTQYFHNNPLPAFNPAWKPPTAHPTAPARKASSASPVKMAEQKPMPDRSHEGQKENWERLRKETGLSKKEMQKLHDDGYSTRNGYSDKDIIKEGKARQKEIEREQQEQDQQDKDGWGKYRRGSKGS